MLRLLVFLAVLFAAPLAMAQEAKLTVDSPEQHQVVIVEPVAGTAGEVTACITPCSLTVVPGRHLVVAEGIGLRRWSNTVSVPPEGRELRLRAPSRAGYAWGVVLTTFGVSALLHAAMVSAQFLDGASLDDGYNQMMLGIEGVVAAIGVGSLTGGILLMRGNTPGPEN